MKVIKNINNNVSLCEDAKGREVIAFGKGIGFTKPPYEIPLEKVERTFYNIDDQRMALLDQIPEEVFEISVRIVDFASSRIAAQINPNIAFTLADHIAFAIERARKHMKVRMPDAGMVEAQYPREMEVGRQAVKYIDRRMHIGLPKDEAVSIALHFANAESFDEEQGQASLNTERLSQDVLNIIEDDYHTIIEHGSWNCTRFLTHLNYLFSRIEQHEVIAVTNMKLYDEARKEYPDAYACACHIGDYLKQNLSYEINDEERLYLMMHINRLTTREKA